MSELWLTTELRLPRIEGACVIDGGQSLGVFIREANGTLSTIRITADQLAD